MRPCLEDEEIFALVDGAASEKDAAVWRKHIEGCERCTKSVQPLERALAVIAEDEPLDATAHADAVMAAIERGDRVTKRRRVQPVVLGGLALAAALLVGIGIGRRHSDDGFTARGMSEGSALARDVAITLRANGRPIAPNDELPPDARFDAMERNIGTSPAHALVFAVDAKANVHWLYPAYESTATDPPSITIASNTRNDLALGTAVAFDDLAAGPLSLVTILSPAPLHVSQIETRGAALAPDELRRAFPETDVRVLPVRIR